jgi:hypothetical protein
MRNLTQTDIFALITLLEGLGAVVTTGTDVYDEEIISLVYMADLRVVTPAIHDAVVAGELPSWWADASAQLGSSGVNEIVKVDLT